MKISNDTSLYASMYQKRQESSPVDFVDQISKDDSKKNNGTDSFGENVAPSATANAEKTALKFTANGVDVKGKDEVAVSKSDGKKTATQEFLEFMDKTPAERMREQILSGMGLDEESLKSLPYEEREKIEEKIAAIIRQSIEDDIKEEHNNVEVVKAQQPAVPPHSMTSNEMNNQILSVQEAAAHDNGFDDKDQGIVDVSGVKDEEQKRFEEMLVSAIDL
ncbi:MAG: hypothetical protein GY804_05365 [Alphaproteobacteria bacterium]|nr:hypothetical protein [Alphaproteobacteria bacterium]